MYFYLQNRFPGFKSFGTNDLECTICLGQRIQELDKTNNERDRASQEIILFKRIYDKKPIRLKPESRYFAVPTRKSIYQLNNSSFRILEKLAFICKKS